MKRILAVIMLAVVAISVAPMAMAQGADVVAPAIEQGADVIASTGSDGWDMALKIVLPLILLCSSLMSNMFTVKPGDSPGWVAVKRIINTLALNLSPNAGH